MLDIKIGDVVKLKSGGPTMTVHEVESSKVYTVWADKNHVILHGFFKPEILEIAKKGKIDPGYF